MERIGLTGHGKMGGGIAKNLVKAGFPVLIHTIFTPKQAASDQRLSELQKMGAKITYQLDDLFSKSDVLITCLPTSEVIETILIGENGLLSYDRPSVKTVLDFSTAKPESTRKISGLLKKKGIEMLDTPMSGGPQQAEEATVNLAIGGETASFEAMEHLLKNVAKGLIFVGPSGSGHVIKLLNNFMGQVNMCTASAACLLCEKFGIDLKRLYDFISMSGGNSAGFQAQMNTIFEGKYPLKFSIDFAKKDMNYAREIFELRGVKYEVQKVLTDIFNEAQAAGYGPKDIGTIYQFLKERDAQ